MCERECLCVQCSLLEFQEPHCQRKKSWKFSKVELGRIHWKIVKVQRCMIKICFRKCKIHVTDLCGNKTIAMNWVKLQYVNLYRIRNKVTINGLGS